MMSLENGDTKVLSTKNCINWTVIAVTCGGKSTLANKLKTTLEKKFACKLIAVDDYYKDEKDIPFDPAINLYKWDTLEAFHLSNLHHDVKAAIEHLKCEKTLATGTKAILIIEGIVIFDDVNLNRLFDRRYFMTLPYDVTLKRRRKRVYEPPEEPELFDAHVWPEYVGYRDKLRRSKEEMLELDATRSLDDIFVSIVSDLNSSFLSNELISNLSSNEKSD